MKRTEINLTPEKVGKKVHLFGWIDSKRDHGKVVFLDLRDRSGFIQMVGGPELKGFSDEDVVSVLGEVKKRGAKFINKNIPTGGIEIQVETIDLLSKSKPLPFSVHGEGRDLNEETRLDYRYLDIRRERIKSVLHTRHKLLQSFRRSLSDRGFWEIETPCLGKSTPEGARDFLVPSRFKKGSFYALPQSPQQYKQLLMVGGIEKYFQLARCFRDEDLRANRQYEFTQVDIEMSFVTRDEVLDIIEPVIIEVFESLGKKIYKKPFPRVTYKQAMKKYGDDKFDIRKTASSDSLGFAWVVDFPLFEKTETRSIGPVHHPFTAPNPEDISLLERNPLKVRSWQYDLICNGNEVGGGSIRITDPVIQEKIFSLLGHSKKQIGEKFGHLLEAFGFGVPPHGGIALGFDRLVMLATGEENIRETIAFPVTARGRTAVMNAPSGVDPKQLSELGIKLVTDLKKKK
jgi:aspartyl-tRNA synthetase